MYSRIAILCNIQNTYAFIIPVLAYLITALHQTPGAGVTLIKCYNAEKRQHQMGIYMYLGLITSGCFLVLSQPLSPVLTHSKKESKIVDTNQTFHVTIYKKLTRENTRSRHFHAWQNRIIVRIFWFQRFVSKVVFFYIQHNYLPHENQLSGSFLNRDKCRWT